MAARIARLVLSFPVAVIWLSPLLLVALIHRDSAYDLFCAWSRFQLKLLGIDVEVENLADLYVTAKGILFVGLNQQSLIDTLIWPAILPIRARFVFNFEYGLIPWVGWLSFLLGNPFVILQSPSSRKKLIPKCVSLLQQRINVAIEIEGKRSKDGSIGDYKRGPALIAIRAQAAIVPVFMYGTREILPYGSLLPRPGKVKVALCPNIRTAERGISEDARHQLTEDLRFLATKLSTRNW